MGPVANGWAAMEAVEALERLCIRPLGLINSTHQLFKQPSKLLMARSPSHANYFRGKSHSEKTPFGGSSTKFQVAPPFGA